MPKTLNGKVIAVLVVIGLFVAYPACWAWQEKQRNDAAWAIYEKAEAMFLELCKKAKEFIHRTVESVEGVRSITPRMATTPSTVAKAKTTWWADREATF